MTTERKCGNCISYDPTARRESDGDVFGRCIFYDDLFVTNSSLCIDFAFKKTEVLCTECAHFKLLSPQDGYIIRPGYRISLTNIGSCAKDSIQSGAYYDGTEEVDCDMFTEKGT